MRRMILIGLLGAVFSCGLEIKPPAVSPNDLPVDQLAPAICLLPLSDDIDKIEREQTLNQVSLSNICGGQTASKSYTLNEEDKKWLRLIRDCVVFDEVELEDPGLGWQPTATSSTSTTALPAEFRLQFALTKGETACKDRPPLIKLHVKFLGAAVQLIEREPVQIPPAKQIDEAFQDLNPKNPDDLFSFCTLVKAEAGNPCGCVISRPRLRIKGHKEKR